MQLQKIFGPIVPSYKDDVSANDRCLILISISGLESDWLLEFATAPTTSTSQLPAREAFIFYDDLGGHSMTTSIQFCHFWPPSYLNGDTIFIINIIDIFAT